MNKLGWRSDGNFETSSLNPDEFEVTREKEARVSALTMHAETPKSHRSSFLLHLHLFSQMRVRAINAFAAAISGFRMF